MTSASAWAAFAPTQQELAYVQLIFNAADPQKLGIITGDAAVPVLAGSNLPPEKLGEIWAVADHENNGYLTKKGVAAAVRLIAWAQVGEPVTEALLSKSGPLPAINGIQGPGDPVRASSPIPRSATGSSALAPFTSADRSKFLRLFAKEGPVGGLLSGDKARNIFFRSRLPVEKLSQIWNLADTQNRGALDANDFAIGMYLIQASMANPSFVLPTILPLGFYEQVSGGTPKPLEPQSTGGSIPLSPTRGGFRAIPPPLKPQVTGASAGPLHPQVTGSSHIGAPSPGPSAFPSSQSSTFSAVQPRWDITSEEKVKADGFFDSLDTQRRGYIEGDVAVPFMLGSTLPDDLLAQIWDLADINGDGKLTRDGFAVALHLINGKLGGKEIPQSLPPSLIPPSMRKGGTTAPSVAPAQVHKDLWDLDDDARFTTTPPRLPSGPKNILPLSDAGVVSTQSRAKTGTSSPPAAGIRRPPTRDIFDDDDTEVEAAEAAANSIAIANTKNQLASTQRSLATVQTDRAKTDTSVTESAGQLAALESQLASAKAQHQTETKLVADLQARQREQLSDITKTRGELVTAESDLSALRAEKAEIEGSVLRDKEEIRDLQRKLKEVGEQTTLTKGEVERLKRDARQQKGLLAIAKKQLATAEENAEKARKEVNAEEEELARFQEDIEHTNAATEALASATKVVLTPDTGDGVASVVPTADPVAFPATAPLPETPEVPNPPILTKSNNPFGRLTRQNSTASTTASPTTFKPFVLPTPVEVGSETPTTEAAVLAPLPPSTDDVTKSDNPFNAVFGIETPPEVDDSPEILTADVAPLSPTHRPSVTPPATKNTESFVASPSDVLSSPAGDPTFEGPQPSENHDSAHTSPQVLTQSELPPVESAGHQQDEDSSDDGATEPEDAFGSKPPRPNQASMPGAFENDVFDESTFTPTSAVKTPAEREADTQTPEHPIPPSSTAAFDDAFELNEPAAAASVRSTSASTATSPFTSLPPPPSAKNDRSSPGSQPPTAFDGSPFSTTRFPTLNDASRPTSTAELDAAFGVKPTISDTTINGTLKPIFQQSFDEAFDFGSATTSKPPITNPTSFTNGHSMNEPSTWPPAAPRADETQTITAARQPAYNPPSGPPPPRTPENSEPSFNFDDAFGTPREIPAFTTMPAPAPVPVPPPVATPAPRPVPRPRPLPDDEEDNRPLSQAIDRARRRSISPPILRSRMSISPPPAPRSGKGQSAKDDGGSKSSKLSLHFFGKNKNKNKDKAGTGSSKKSGIPLPDSPSIDEHGSYRVPPPVASSQRLRRASQIPPVAPDVIGSGGPDDDIAAVRTLVNMGFTRQQAVDALEQNSYDVPTALNKLLGTA